MGVRGLQLGLREQHYLQQAIDSNRLSYGLFSRKFERLFVELYAELGVIMRSWVNQGRDNIYIGIDNGQNASKEQLFQIVSKRFCLIRLRYSFITTELEAAINIQ